MVYLGIHPCRLHWRWSLPVPAPSFLPVPCPVFQYGAPPFKLASPRMRWKNSRARLPRSQLRNVCYNYTKPTSASSLNVHWVLTQCSLNAHSMLTECSLTAPWMFTDCSLTVHWLFTDCSLTVHLKQGVWVADEYYGKGIRHNSAREMTHECMFTERSLNVPFPKCSLNVHWMFTECSLNVHWTFTECSVP